MWVMEHVTLRDVRFQAQFSDESNRTCNLGSFADPYTAATAVCVAKLDPQYATAEAIREFFDRCGGKCWTKNNLL